jgi:uncharacterized membrane protein HdeD (DUF308 family)
MNALLIVFIVGWFGSTWWPGIEVDAPPPRGDPWWWRVVEGVLAGVAAIAVVRLTNVAVDSLLGVTAMIATGKVTGAIVGAVARAARK